jgi:hypothetical protein
MKFDHQLDERRSPRQDYYLGIDLAKQVSQVHTAVDAAARLKAV